ncbi:DUF5000 domain-containing lipoprotein [Compostibacter hankyongensis]|uniref:DUF5000 domain-containing lipoprotein n=1 Tax=Compostibacter hankyongensis TaxID=1007089 RepID=A0ABP8FU90_9BACT
MKKQQFFISPPFCGLLSMLMLAALWQGCKRETDAYIDPKAPAPAQVSGLKITSTPGGAFITYKIPEDPNLFYVKAEYEIQPGVFREAKSSYYTDTLALVGFGDTLSHEVKIYSVGRNNKESEPISLNVKPLTPPVRSIFETLALGSTFGGVFVSFKDSTQANIGITLMVEDSLGMGTWEPLGTYYTAELEGVFAARGLDTVERKFGAYIQDHWLNRSDTLIARLTPRFEELIPKDKFKALKLESDNWQPVAAKYNMENLWDGIELESENQFAPPTKPLPEWFSIDLGHEVIFSRMKLFQRIQYPYNGAWVKKFAIYGSNTLSDDWADWELLATFDYKTPSGLPWPQYTADDLAYARTGQDFAFPDGLPAVRYMRFKVLETYNMTGQFYFGEFTFWGKMVP